MKVVIQIECNDPSEVYQISDALRSMTSAVPVEDGAHWAGCIDPTPEDVQEKQAYHDAQQPMLVPEPVLATPDTSALHGLPLVVDPSMSPGMVSFEQNGVQVGAIVNAPPPPPPLDADKGWPDPPAPAGSLDKDGIPWDSRIHAGSKTQCKDGTWKLRPGVDKAIVEQVRAELKGVQDIPAPQTFGPTPPPLDPGAVHIIPPSVLTPPAVTLVPPPPSAPAATAPANFAEMLKWVGDLITARKITADGVNAACATHGMPKFNLLAGRPDLIPAVWNTICLTVD